MVPDNDMIMNGDTEHLAGFPHHMSDPAIRVRGHRFSAGMIVLCAPDRYVQWARVERLKLRLCLIEMGRVASHNCWVG
jgi:hypothetical protein